MKLTEQLKEKQKELKKRISFLIDEFCLENGDCEIQIDISHDYVILPDNTKRLCGKTIDVNFKI